MFAAVIKMGPNMPFVDGIPLSTLSVMESHDGLPLTERTGLGTPVALIV